jgi:hypothetical protein
MTFELDRVETSLRSELCYYYANPIDLSVLMYMYSIIQVRTDIIDTQFVLCLITITCIIAVTTAGYSPVVLVVMITVIVAGVAVAVSLGFTSYYKGKYHY